MVVRGIGMAWTRMKVESVIGEMCNDTKKYCARLE